MNSDEGDQAAGGEGEGEGSTPTTGKSLAATLGSIEKSEADVTSPVAAHSNKVSTAPAASISSDASPDDSPTETVPRSVTRPNNLLLDHLNITSNFSNKATYQDTHQDKFVCHMSKKSLRPKR